MLKIKKIGLLLVLGTIIFCTAETYAAPLKQENSASVFEERNSPGAVTRSVNLKIAPFIVLRTVDRISLLKGESIEYTIYASSEYHVQIGVYDYDTGQFYEGNRYTSPEAGIITGKLTAARDFKNISLTVYNISERTTAFTGFYTAPR